MALCGTSPRMRPTKPVSTEPGPTSTKVRQPAACMARTCSTKRTGSAICWPRMARAAAGSAGYGAASELAYTGTLGAVNAMSARNSLNGTVDAETTLLWNAVATERRVARRPSALSLASTASMAAVGPESTTCSGALWFAMTTSSP